MGKEFVGTEVVFQTKIGDLRLEVTSKAALCGSNRLPDEFVVSTVSGMVRFLQAVNDGRNIRGPEHFHKVLREGPKGLRIMVMGKPQDPRERKVPPICWDPSQTTFKKL